MITNSLPGLGRGEAIISGPAVPVPCVVKVDYFDDALESDFNGRIGLGGKDVDFRSEWRRGYSEETLLNVFRRLYGSIQEKETKKKEGQPSLEKFLSNK